MYHALPTNPPGGVLVTNERRKLVYTERKKFGSLRSPLVIPRTRLLPIPYFLHPTPPILVKFWVPLYLLFCTLNLTFSQIQNKRRTPGGKYPPLSFWVPGKTPPLCFLGPIPSRVILLFFIATVWVRTSPLTAHRH